MKNNITKKTLRLNEEDSKMLHEKAAAVEMNENDYLRMLIREKAMDVPEVRKQLKELINEVNHVGVNINQIARNSNAGYFGDADRQQLFAYMQKLNVAVEQVVMKLGNK